MNPTDLNSALRAVVADAPPSTIDLDRLVDGEQRRQRTMRMAAVVSGAAASVLMVAVVAFGFSSPATPTHQRTAATGTASMKSALPCPSLEPSGPPRPYQSGNPSPRPVSESCGDAAFRLSGALVRALATHAPGVTVADATGSGQSVRILRNNDENLSYGTGLFISTPAGRGSASVGIEPRTYAPESEAELRHRRGCDRLPSELVCVYHSYPDGTVVTGIDATPKLVGPNGEAGTRQHEVHVFRPDGTLVTFYASNLYYDTGLALPGVTPKVGGKDVPLTLDQLIAIGRDPGLTLYP